MRKSIIAVILITMLAIAGTTGSAFAYTDTTTITVSPGSRVCLNPQRAQFQVFASGSSDRGIRYSIHRSTDGVNFVDVTQSSDTAPAFSYFASSSSQPLNFPNYYKICARNLGGKGATVMLNMQTDSNVH